MHDQHSAFSVYHEHVDRQLQLDTCSMRSISAAPVLYLLSPACEQMDLQLLIRSTSAGQRIPREGLQGGVWKGDHQGGNSSIDRGSGSWLQEHGGCSCGAGNWHAHLGRRRC